MEPVYLLDDSVHDLDKWIEKLTNCKPLTENEIKLLCEMVGKPFNSNTSPIANNVFFYYFS